MASSVCEGCSLSLLDLGEVFLKRDRVLAFLEEHKLIITRLSVRHVVMTLSLTMKTGFVVIDVFGRLLMEDENKLRLVVASINSLLREPFLNTHTSNSNKYYTCVTGLFPTGLRRQKWL